MWEDDPFEYNIMYNSNVHVCPHCHYRSEMDADIKNTPTWKTFVRDMEAKHKAAEDKLTKSSNANKVIIEVAKQIKQMKDDVDFLLEGPERTYVMQKLEKILAVACG